VSLARAGAPQWAREVDGPAELVRVRSDPLGRSAIAVQDASCRSTIIRAFDAGGAPAWSAKLPSDGSCFGPFIASLDYGSDGAVLAGGTASTGFVLGAARVVADGADGFLVLLEP
jgi:hypothetical protein